MLDYLLIETIGQPLSLKEMVEVAECYQKYIIEESKIIVTKQIKPRNICTRPLRGSFLSNNVIGVSLSEPQY